MKIIKHNSINLKRLQHKHSERERAFADEWKKENARGTNVGYGYGILQDLMGVQCCKFKIGCHPIFGFLSHFAFVITQRDAIIVATIIQWLGTNVGFCFLEKCLKKCGYRIVKIEPPQK